MDLRTWSETVRSPPIASGSFTSWESGTGGGLFGTRPSVPTFISSTNEMNLLKKRVADLESIVARLIASMDEHAGTTDVNAKLDAILRHVEGLTMAEKS